MKQNHLSWEEELDLLLSEDISTAIERETKEFDKLTTPLGKSLVLFGAGNLGRQVLAQLRKDGMELLAFADNNPAVWGKFVDGVQVFSPSDAADNFGHIATFVVTIWNTEHSFVETKKQLVALGCINVVSAIPLRWKYSKTLLPFFWLDIPSRTLEEAELARSAFSLWADEFSRREYLAQMKYRILGEFDSLSSPVQQESYFPHDIFNLRSDEKFIDCGAYDGITIKQFLKRQIDFVGKIVAYEPDPINFDQLQQYISSLTDYNKNCIIPMPYAVGAQRSKVHFQATGTMGSTINNNGLLEVDCISLDENLRELEIAPTYIKMDIEGSEMDALAGTSTLIQKTMPILAICVYHRYNDLWQIPLYINSLASNYRFFLRPHEIEGWQLVCYAIPENRLINSKL